MKKVLRYFLLAVLIIVAAFSIFAFASGRTYLFKAVWYNFANIDDYEKFTNNTVVTGDHQPWPLAADYNKPVMPVPLRGFLNDISTIAVLVLRNDSLLYEHYDQGYTDSSWSGSFSMAKSITSLLVGAALKDGSIASLQDPVGHYLPEFAAGNKAGVRIIDLLTMSSGTDWDESYSNPLSVTTEAYYGSDIYKTATSVKVVQTPGTVYRYKSGDTQLLGLVVEKATGKSLSAYASEKLWKPLGAEHPALWSTDHTGGHEKAYCCFNTNARDFARIGALMLDSGRWKGQEIITPEYFKASVTACRIPDVDGQPTEFYGYQWWIDPTDPAVFYARGILGQYIVCIPDKNMVVVRLGKKRGSVQNTVPKEVSDLVRWARSL